MLPPFPPLSFSLLCCSTVFVADFSRLVEACELKLFFEANLVVVVGGKSLFLLGGPPPCFFGFFFDFFFFVLCF